MRRFFVLLLVALMCVAPGVGLLHLAVSAPVDGGFQADAVSAASPNYRVFSETDLKSMKEITHDPDTADHRGCLGRALHLQQELRPLLLLRAGLGRRRPLLPAGAGSRHQGRHHRRQDHRRRRLRGDPVHRRDAGQREPRRPEDAAGLHEERRERLQPRSPQRGRGALRGPGDPGQRARRRGRALPPGHAPERGRAGLRATWPTTPPPAPAPPTGRRRSGRCGPSRCSPCSRASRPSTRRPSPRTRSSFTATSSTATPSRWTSSSPSTPSPVPTITASPTRPRPRPTSRRTTSAPACPWRTCWKTSSGCRTRLPTFRYTARTATTGPSPSTRSWASSRPTCRCCSAGTIDGADLGPEPDGNGPIYLIKPLETADPTETNNKYWMKSVRSVRVNTTTDLGPDPAKIPTDRIIVYGLADAGNVPNEWFLAEGCTGYGFEEWILIENPNPWATHVIVDYMIEGSTTPVTLEYDVPAESRFSINVADQAGVGADKNVSARVEGYHGDSIVVERAMYWGGRERRALLRRHPAAPEHLVPGRRRHPGRLRDLGAGAEPQCHRRHRGHDPDDRRGRPEPAGPAGPGYPRQLPQELQPGRVRPDL